MNCATVDEVELNREYNAMEQLKVVAGIIIELLFKPVSTLCENMYVLTGKMCTPGA